MVPSGPVRPEAHIPLLRCPECEHTEAAGFIGNRSGDVVCYAPWRFADHRGFYFCRACFVVWNTLPVQRRLPSEPDGYVETNPYTRLGTTPSWAPEGNAKWRRLHRVERAVLATAGLRSQGHEALRRAGDRLRDAEIVASTLQLTPVVREAVSYHVCTFAERARLRDITSPPFPREEAFILATVALVIERHGGHASYAALASSLRFRGGSVVPLGEFERAKAALSAWYEENVWRT